MKKLLALLLCAVMCISFVACSSGVNEAEENSAEPASAAEENSVREEPETVKPRIKIYDPADMESKLTGSGIYTPTDNIPIDFAGAWVKDTSDPESFNSKYFFYKEVSGAKTSRDLFFGFTRYYEMFFEGEAFKGLTSELYIDSGKSADLYVTVKTYEDRTRIEFGQDGQVRASLTLDPDGVITKTAVLHWLTDDDNRNLNKIYEMGDNAVAAAGLTMNDIINRDSLMAAIAAEN